MPDGVQGDVSWNDLMDAICESKACQTCRREDQAVVIPRIEFLQACDHVAPHVLELEMGEVMSKLSKSSQ